MSNTSLGCHLLKKKEWKGDFKLHIPKTNLMQKLMVNDAKKSARMTKTGFFPPIKPTSLGFAIT